MPRKTWAWGALAFGCIFGGGRPERASGLLQPAPMKSLHVNYKSSKGTSYKPVVLVLNFICILKIISRLSLEQF